MTDSPDRPPLAFQEPTQVLAVLREKGHRISTACRIVLDVLFEAEGPVSAQFIADGGKDGGTGLEVASVYRNLERLEALGVVRHVHLGHGAGLYMLVGNGEKEFLACERCSRVTILDPSELEPVRTQIRNRFGYQARFGHFPIIGLCASCAEASDPEPASDQHEDRHAEVGHEHEHSHGDHVHSHPHTHGDGDRHAHHD